MAFVRSVSAANPVRWYWDGFADRISVRRYRKAYWQVGLSGGTGYSEEHGRYLILTLDLMWYSVSVNFWREY